MLSGAQCSISAIEPPRVGPNRDRHRSGNSRSLSASTPTVTSRGAPRSSSGRIAAQELRGVAAVRIRLIRRAPHLQRLQHLQHVGAFEP